MAEASVSSIPKYADKRKITFRLVRVKKVAFDIGNVLFHFDLTPLLDLLIGYDKLDNTEMAHELWVVAYGSNRPTRDWVDCRHHSAGKGTQPGQHEAQNSGWEKRMTPHGRALWHAGAVY